MDEEYVQEHILTGGIVCGRQRGETGAALQMAMSARTIGDKALKTSGASRSGFVRIMRDRLRPCRGRE
jgi:hypothetical protein